MDCTWTIALHRQNNYCTVKWAEPELMAIMGACISTGSITGSYSWCKAKYDQNHCLSIIRGTSPKPSPNYNLCLNSGTASFRGYFWRRIEDILACPTSAVLLGNSSKCGTSWWRWSQLDQFHFRLGQTGLDWHPPLHQLGCNKLNNPGLEDILTSYNKHNTLAQNN